VPGRTGILDAELANYRRAATFARMQRVNLAIRAYFLAFGDYPNSLDDLVNSSPALLSPSDLSDSRGVPFGYNRTAEQVILSAVSDTGEPDLVMVRDILPGAESSLQMVNPSQR
jgi:hypothetical protein